MGNSKEQENRGLSRSYQFLQKGRKSDNTSGGKEQYGIREKAENTYKCKTHGKKEYSVQEIEEKRS